MSHSTPPSLPSKCPIKRITQSQYFRIFYIHALIFLSFFGITSASDDVSAGNRCPIGQLSRKISAFVSPSKVTNFLGQTESRITATIGINRCGVSLSNTTGVNRKQSVLMMSTIDEVATKVKKAKKHKLDKAVRVENSTNPLQVHVIGLSHHNAGVEVREKLAVPKNEWNLESARFCEQDNIVEAAVLSTCNRFEVYIASHSARSAIREAYSHLQKRSGLSHSELRKSLFILSGDDAVWHILRVSAGLDSLVVGEGQILSQVRQCYLHCTEEEGSGGKVVSRLFNTAVSAGKRVRSETSISKGAVSISSAAVEFGKFRCEPDLRKPFEKARLLIVGAGTMSRLLLIHLQSLGVKKVTLVNRSMPKCRDLEAEFKEIEFDIKLSDQLDQTILESDIVFTSTSSTGCIITKDGLEKINAGRSHPILFVDISVPRNIEEECNEVDGIFSYDVDDLKMVVARNTALRRREILEAEDILVEEQNKFQGWQQSLSAIPAISKMQEKFETMRAEEVRKASNKLTNLSPKEMEVVEKLSKGIVNKMMHGPMSALRQPEGPEEKKKTLHILKAMFKLEKELMN